LDRQRFVGNFGQDRRRRSQAQTADPHTRQPEFLPPWRETSVVTALSLAPLPAGDIRRLAETRLGVETLPENLARQLTDKAEGNALFAEEILSFLTERGVLRIVEGKVEFDAGAVASALPASVQACSPRA
jgi:predicted ATPase